MEEQNGTSETMHDACIEAGQNVLCINVSKMSLKTENFTLQFFSSLSDFIEEKLGSKYVKNRTMEFAKSFEEASPSTSIFFILSPGVNPLKDVEQLGKILGFTEDAGNFHNVSLGQGQEVVGRLRRQYIDDLRSKDEKIDLGFYHRYTMKLTVDC